MIFFKSINKNTNFSQIQDFSMWGRIKRLFGKADEEAREEALETLPVAMRLNRNNARVSINDIKGLPTSEIGFPQANQIQSRYPKSRSVINVTKDGEVIDSVSSSLKGNGKRPSFLGRHPILNTIGSGSIGYAIGSAMSGDDNQHKDNTTRIEVLEPETGRSKVDIKLTPEEQNLVK